MSDAMDWPDDVFEDAREAAEIFFQEVPRHQADEALMLAFAYGFMEAHERIRREHVLRRYKASIEKLKLVDIEAR